MLIGLHGKAGSGKDQSFKYMATWAKKAGTPARREAFADRLKLSAARALGFEGNITECVSICDELKQPGWEIVIREPGGQVEHPITGREYLQFYGTEAHREVFGTDFWVDAVLNDYDPDDVSTLLVVTDVRFPNEAQAIRHLGGEVWWVVRPDHQIPEGTHISELALPQSLVDRVLRNTGPLSQLRAEINALMQGLVYA